MVADRLPSRYVGSSLNGAAGTPNFTRDELDSPSFSPSDSSAGADGEPVFLPAGEKARSARLWHLHKFNVVASDRIPANRTLKDVRSDACRERTYERLSALPAASVIIVFHNEAW